MRGMICLVAIGLVAFAASSLHAAAAPRPNVLLIMADDLGFSDLGCYGGEIDTPNLDALAKDGLRFTQFYNTARCWPSRAAVLTGHYAQSVRRDAVPNVKSGTPGARPAWAPLLPDLLRPLGYRSYHSGKWHVDGKPLDNGFDHSYSLDDHDRYFTPRNHVEDGKRLPQPGADAGYYATTAIADHAIKCLKDHAANHKAEPFFHFLAFTAPHFPLQAPQEDVAKYKERYLRGWDALREERWRRIHAMNLAGRSLSPVERTQGPPWPFPEQVRKLGPHEVNRPLPWDQLTPAQREFQACKMAVHAAMVDRMDREIGRVLAQLRATGGFENTLILFCSDNGATAEMMVRGDGHDPDAHCGTGATFLSLGPGWSTMCNTPLRKHKSWVHEGGIATPLIVHWSAGVKSRDGFRRTPAHLVDVVPTVLELAGSAAPKEWKGRAVPAAPGKSLVPVLAADLPIERESLWFYHSDNRAIRVGDWKLVSAGKGGPWELYDLSADRAEANDLAAKHPERVRELSDLWTKQAEHHFSLARE